MSENPFSSFQEQVDELLIRHRSFLDVTSKFQESGTRINRSLTKAVTECGCIRIDAQKQPYPTDAPVKNGKITSKRIYPAGCVTNAWKPFRPKSENLFILLLYAICWRSPPEVMEKESKKLTTLGVFNLR